MTTTPSPDALYEALALGTIDAYTTTLGPSVRLALADTTYQCRLAADDVWRLTTIGTYGNVSHPDGPGVDASGLRLVGDYAEIARHLDDLTTDL